MTCCFSHQPSIESWETQAPAPPPPPSPLPAASHCNLHPRSPPPHAARRGPYGEASRLLFQFKTPEDLERWAPFSDAELGGQSTAALTAAPDLPVRPCSSCALQPPLQALLLPRGSTHAWLAGVHLPAGRPRHPCHPCRTCRAPPCCCSASMQGTAVLAGEYSSALGEGADARLRRSGFAGITSRPQGAPMDLEDFDALVFRWVESPGCSPCGPGRCLAPPRLPPHAPHLCPHLHARLWCRVRGDGRQYIASVRCENWIVDQRSNDVWQAFLFARCGCGLASLHGWVAGRVGGAERASATCRRGCRGQPAVLWPMRAPPTPALRPARPPGAARASGLKWRSR